MKGAQFVRGMINGNSQTYESADLAQVLPKDYYYLMDLKVLGITLTHDANLRFFAQTIISRTEPDAVGRQGYINHTVCFRLEPYILKDFVVYWYNPESFEKAYNTGMYNFDMAPLPTLANPLPTPPTPSHWR